MKIVLLRLAYSIKTPNSTPILLRPLLKVTFKESSQNLVRLAWNQCDQCEQQPKHRISTLWAAKNISVVLFGIGGGANREVYEYLESQSASMVKSKDESKP